jgi:phosphopantetheine adenylyltransferase
MGQMKNYKQLLKELPSNKVVFAFGSFEPPTAGHELQIKAVRKLAQEQRADHVIYASKDLKESLLNAEKRVQYMNMMFPGTNVKSTEIASIVEASKELNKKYKNLILVTSEDCKQEYESVLNKKNKSEFFFETIEVVAVGDKDPDANKLCESAKKGDYTKFKAGLPTGIREIDSRRLMNDIRQSLGLEMVKEEINLVKDETREKYFRGEIFNVGELVESNGVKYEIVKRGSNHLLLKEESGSLVSKWIQDVKTIGTEMINEITQPSGDTKVEGATDSPVVNKNSKYNFAKDRLRLKDFTKLTAMSKGVKEEAEVTHDNDDKFEDQKVEIAQPQRGIGHTLASRDDHHRRRKIAYQMGESVEEFKEEDIDAMIAEVNYFEDVAELYEDDELAIVDEETGEAIDTEGFLEEEAIMEVLSRVERMRAKQKFARSRSKRQRSTKIALKRFSPSTTINKRARKLAIALMKKRMLRGRDVNKISVGEKERLETSIHKRKDVINRVAMKLVSRIRGIEKARMSHTAFTKGAPTVAF